MTILPTVNKKKSVSKKIRKSPRPDRETTAGSLKRVAHSSTRAEPAVKKSASGDSGASTSAAASGGILNSDDEYEEMEVVSNDHVEEEFVERLATRGLVIKDMIGDGACMFRAIAEQVYGDQEMHSQIRRLCMDYMSRNRDYFHDFITEDFDQYIERKREDTVHGNHLELQAISELFARPVEVYQYSDEPINILLPRGSGGQDEAGPSTHHSTQSQSQQQPNAPIRLSYHGGVHYNAILDPNSPTIGVGLGLPGMSPTAAEKALMTSAIASSEREHIEETMLKDKLDMTDWQRTQADIDEQITRESYVSYLRDVETKNSSTTTAPAASTTKKSPIKSCDDTPTTSTQAGLYEELLAAQSIDWDEDVTMAQALLLSQQEYLSIPGPSTSSHPK